MAEERYYIRRELDLATAAQVRADLQLVVAGSDAHLLIDCTHLTFIDSTGIALLLETHRDLEERDRYMLVANVPQRCRRVFDVLGLTDLLRYDRSPDLRAV